MKHTKNTTHNKLTVRFDSVGGASGDLILSSLVDLGADPAKLQRQLASLAAGQFKLRATPVHEHGFEGTRLSVNLPHQPHEGHHNHKHHHDHDDHGHGHHHNHDHEGHTHGHHHDHDHDHHHHGHHHTGKQEHHHSGGERRNLGNILKMISKSGLSPWVMNLSSRTFERLAAAEAKVHGTTIDKIHFHEAGALDSIVDIVASCLALEMLDVGSVIVGPLPIGHGTVNCAHGILPLPAPAVVELLKGYPVVQIDEPFETVTPTGAALLTTWKDLIPASTSSAMSILRSGLGFGHTQFNSRANTLRATLLKNAENSQADHDDCLVLECNLDDTVPELIGSLAGTLMERGALDVFTVPIQMKKQRPGTLLTVLCKPADRAMMLDLVFAETTTFGIREHMTHRTLLNRRHEKVKTPYGPVRLKIGTWQGRDITVAPEYSDCAQCAARHGTPVRKVYEAAKRSG